MGCYRRNDQVTINPIYFRQLPIFPADAGTQAAIVAQVDALLAEHAALNVLREQGYVIGRRRDGAARIAIPYDLLLDNVRRGDPAFEVYDLFEAEGTWLTLAAASDRAATVGSNVYTPERHPTSVVLRHNKLWLDVPDEAARGYLRGYLSRPQWRGRTWDAIKRLARIPADVAALAAFFAAEAAQRDAISARLDTIAAADALDEHILDLYRHQRARRPAALPRMRAAHRGRGECRRRRGARGDEDLIARRVPPGCRGLSW